MKFAEGVTGELKAQYQLAWVGQMNNIRNRAEEIIRNELIYLITTWSDQLDERLVVLIFFTIQYRLNHGGSDFLLAG